MKFYKSRELRGALFRVDRYTDRHTDLTNLFVGF
jgi:hypothetical protein